MSIHQHRLDTYTHAHNRLDILKNFVHYGLEQWGSDQRGVNTTRRFLLEWLSFTYRSVRLSRPPARLLVCAVCAGCGCLS